MTYTTRQVTVAQTAVPLLSYSEDRVAYEIVAPSANNVYIAPTGAVTTGNGHRLPPNVPFRAVKRDPWDVRMSVWAISDAGNNVVTIREDILDPDME